MRIRKGRKISTGAFQIVASPLGVASFVTPPLKASLRTSYMSLGTDAEAEEKPKPKDYDKQYYSDLILQHIKKRQSAPRKDIDKLLWDKLPEDMDDKQRKNKITYLLIELKSTNIQIVVPQQKHELSGCLHQWPRHS